MSNNETRIFVQNLELLARIGIHRHELDGPQPVRINAWVSVTGPGNDDLLENTFNYEILAEKIRQAVGSGHINLAETLAERIAKDLLSDKRVRKAGVRVIKLQALAGAEGAGVEIERHAEP